LPSAKSGVIDHLFPEQIDHPRLSLSRVVFFHTLLFLRIYFRFFFFAQEELYMIRK